MRSDTFEMTQTERAPLVTTGAWQPRPLTMTRYVPQSGA
jgi:hypothetical protein